MGVDNVLAIGGAATGSILLIVLGLAISVPIIVWGSQLVIRLVDRFPSVVLLGGAVLAWTGYSMIVREPLLASWFEGHPATKLVAVILIFSISLAPWYTARLAERDASRWSSCCRRVLVWMLCVEIAASVWKLQVDYLLATETGEYILEAVRWLGWLPLVAAYLWLRERLDAAPPARRPRLIETLAARIAAQYDRGMRAKLLLLLGLCLSLTAEAHAQAAAGRRHGLLRPAFRPVSPLSRQYRRGPDVSRRRGGDGDGPSARAATRRPESPCWRRSCATRASRCPNEARSLLRSWSSGPPASAGS